MISHGVWQRQFGGAPDAIGKSITYNGEPWTVVGVMPAKFDFYGRTNINNDVFTPLGRLHNLEFMQDRKLAHCAGDARLKPGVSIEQARSELSAVAARHGLAISRVKHWRRRNDTIISRRLRGRLASIAACNFHRGRIHVAHSMRECCQSHVGAGYDQTQGDCLASRTGRLPLANSCGS